MSEKRYYWLKLPADFFTDNKPIKRLRKIAGGDTYTIIYLKMLLASLKTGGKLYLDDIEDTPAEEIALLIDEDPDNVQVTLQFLIQKGLAEEGRDEIFLTKVPEMVGSESASAERKRRQRDKEKLGQCHTEIGQSHNEVTPQSRRVELEKELEIDIECVAKLGNEKITKTDYNTLISQFGKAAVDQTIKRIVDTPYYGCLNVEKISAWCKELKTRSTKKQVLKHGFEGREYDYSKLEIEPDLN